MAKYPAMITTNKGRDLVSKSNATGKAINWTRIALGEGQNTGNIYTMIDIVDKKIDIVINKATDLTNGKWKIQGDINNEQLDIGFFCREIGVFAKCEGDDNEVLFAYTNGGNYVDYIPDKTTHVDTKKVTCMFAVGDAEHINIINNDESFLRKEDLNEHNSDPNAHGGLITKVQSELTRHNTDISSHPPITAMIAKILGVTDWQENPAATLKDIKNLLGMGGIVAQRLEETGFVKFANGFTIQWGVFRKVSEGEQGGNWNENQKTRKFPIQFTTDKIILIVGDGGIYDGETVKATAASGAQSVRGRVLDKASFKIAVDASDGNPACDVFFVALGV